jgi:hypothetical protein
MDTELNKRCVLADTLLILVRHKRMSLYLVLVQGSISAFHVFFCYYLLVLIEVLSLFTEYLDSRSTII